MENEKDIVTRYRSGLRQMFLTLTGSESRSEELVEETLALVLQKLRKEGIAEMGRLSGFVYTTARYVYLSWLRQAGNRTSVLCSYSFDTVALNDKALSEPKSDPGPKPIAEAV